MQHSFLVPAQNLNHPLCLAVKFFCFLISSVSIFLSLFSHSVFLLLHLSWGSSGKAASCQKGGKGKQWKHSPSAGDIRGRKDEKYKHVISFHSGVGLTETDSPLGPRSGHLISSPGWARYNGEIKSPVQSREAREVLAALISVRLKENNPVPSCALPGISTNCILERREEKVFRKMTALCSWGTSVDTTTKLSACGKAVSSEWLTPALCWV